MVQVAKEAGVQAGIGEVVQQRAGIWVLLLPELAQAHGRVATDAQTKNRVVCLVKKGVQARQTASFSEAGQQIFAITLQWMRTKIGFMPVTRQVEAATVRGAANPGTLDQDVVFNETQEHAAQQPMHASLGDDLVAPALNGFSGAVGIAGGLPFGVQAGLEVRQGVDAFT